MELVRSFRSWKLLEGRASRVSDDLGTVCEERAESSTTPRVCPEHLEEWSRFLLKRGRPGLRGKTRGSVFVKFE